jgi:Domain of unknown function (DUF4333)
MIVKGPSALAATLVLAYIALPLAGCGEEVVLDSTKTEEQLTAEYERGGVKVATVDCPSGVKVEKGAKVDCTVKSKAGTATTVTLRILNEDADLEIVDPTKSLEDLNANK